MGINGDRIVLEVMRIVTLLLVFQEIGKERRWTAHTSNDEQMKNPLGDDDDRRRGSETQEITLEETQKVSIQGWCSHVSQG